MNLRGFTLAEMLIVLAIVAVIAAFAVPGTIDAYQRARAVADLTRAELMRTYVESLYTAPRFTPPPFTEGPDIPFDGEGFSLLSADDRARLATISEVLLARRVTDIWPRWTTSALNGRPAGLSAADGAPTCAFDPAANAWTGAASLVSVPERTAALESRRSDPSLAPSAADGANFRLDGETDLPANRQVFYVFLPRVPIALARRMVALRQPGFLPADAAAACDAGEVVYPAPADGETTVFLYVTHH